MALTGMAGDSMSGPPGYTFLAFLYPDFTVRWEWQHETGDDTTEQGWSVAVSPGGEVTLLRIFEYQPPHHWDLTRFRP